jgi:hypothetical protein
VFWTLLPAFLIHQFEEYSWPGGFRAWYNREIFDSRDPEKPLTRTLAFIVNVPLTWTLLIAAANYQTEWPWITFTAVGIVFANSWLHISMAVIKKMYIPGTMTSILLLLPLTSYIYYYYVVTWTLTFPMLLVSILIGILVHMLLVGALRERHTAAVTTPPEK